MTSQPTYTQRVKNEARLHLLRSAVQALTTKRHTATVVRLSEFEATLKYATDYARRHGFRGLDTAALEAESAAFKALFFAHVGSKRPDELRVLYLCGPEPVNDLAVLLELGVLPHNVWAIESNALLYQAAVDQLARHSGFLKIHHGDAESFFSLVNERFDIVYLDACGALPGGKPNTLRSQLALFVRERLAPLGALVTTFAEPPAEKRSSYVDLLNAFFATRYNDCPKALWEAGADPAISMGGDFGDWAHLRPFIEQELDAAYSDFVTRFLVDIARQLVPYARVHDARDVSRQYFSPPATQEATLERALTPSPQFDRAKHSTMEQFWSDVFTNTGAIHLHASDHSLVHFLRRGDRDLLNAVHTYRLQHEMLSDAFIRTSLLTELFQGYPDIASIRTLAALESKWLDSHAQYFCDVPFPRLMINCLLGIYGRPYFPNPTVCTRVRYQAKQTTMYSDCLILDQCRYFFDFLPTIDLIPARMASPAFQLVARSCIDRLGWHDFSSTTHPFRGSALAGMGEIPSAEPYNFAERRQLD